MKLAVVGTGYVGLVTGVCLAKFGNDVTCIDSNEQKIESLRRGIVPFYEPGLAEIIENTTESGRLTFSTDLATAVHDALMCFITVGTPSLPDGRADLNGVESVARTIGRTMDDYKLVVVKSTVPVSTCDRVRNAIAEELQQRGKDIPFDVASNPEFLREGNAVRDFLEPDRVVIGVDTPRAEECMRKLYSFLPLEKCILMDVHSSEMTKYAANAMLATRISFMNEVAAICERVGADVEKVRVGIGSDPRIGYQFLSPGCGYGGSCFPKDIRALKEFARNENYEPKILQAVEDVNEDQKHLLFRKMEQHFGSLRGKTIGIWGLAFKPQTSDTREAPAQSLILDLVRAGARVLAHDPKAIDETRESLGELHGVIYVNNQYDAVNGADALALVTEWDTYKQPDFRRIRTLLFTPILFDGRNQYSPAEMKALGFRYFSIGRPDVS